MEENYVNQPVSLYIHIPFCVKKCAYCDFLSASADKERQKRYVEALLAEISYWGKRFHKAQIRTVYFGGGTPSVLDQSLFVEVLCKLKEAFPNIGKEISMEMNPKTVTEEKLHAYKEAGINRLSIGLQSANDEELRLLGRIHTYEDFLDTYHMARRQGYVNINVDLLSALPGQSVKSYANTLEKVLEQKPEHISAYSLIIEENTSFYETYHGREELLPDEETDRAMYSLTKEILAGEGYGRYEISNYSLKGKECIHNMVYWQRGNYLGLGLGSSSMVNNVRFLNTPDFESYVNYWERKEFGEHWKHEETRDGFSMKKLPNICKDIVPLTKKEQMEEFMFLGLRMIRGVSIKEFEALFGKSIFEVYGTKLSEFERLNLLTISDRVALTDRGLDVSNRIFAEFLL